MFTRSAKKYGSSQRRGTDSVEKKVALLVPVFNAATYVAALVESIEAAYPKPQARLRFIFSDDASKEEKLFAFYASHKFFRRKDVVLIRNKKNKGYTVNVNAAIATTADDEDVILLNSDTEIAPRFVEDLQKIALENRLCASVTPVTNLGTIASVFNWPNGMNWSSELTVAEINRELAKLAPSLKPVQLPTPVGFCMYLPKKVWLRVGEFNEEVFPRGYGEENDWACRATQMGFRHYLAPNLFVKHASGKSFKETKSKLISYAMDQLSRMYPTYHRDIQQHVQNNAWETARWNIMVRLSSAHRKKLGRKLISYVLHNDPNHSAGGVEASVKKQANEKLAEGFDVLYVFPFKEGNAIRYQSVGDFQWDLRLIHGQFDFIGRLDEIFNDVDVLHVHHFLGIGPDILSFLADCKVPRKKITLHDYWTVCPTVKLIGMDQKYCGIPNDPEICNRCLTEKFPKRNIQIQRFRLTTLSFIRGFSEIEVPSKEAKEILVKGFSTLGDIDRIVKFKIVPNSVRTVPAPKAQRISFRKRVIFLGAFSAEKGGALVNEIVEELGEAGLEVEVWGVPGVIDYSPLSVMSYKSSDELLKVRERASGAIVCVPSVWPETFSYTFYEALSILNAPVVVGPFGHPASVTDRLKVGEVMKSADSRSLKRAILACAENYDFYKERVLRLEVKDNKLGYRPTKVFSKSGSKTIRS
jgi:GT2 family glycosyltransferase/glycosyltransferase involved in cell wall biosynthesis